MKKLYTTLFLAFMLLSAYAQNPTPNAGFENWTQIGNRWDPNDWSTLNPQTAIIGTLTCTRSTDAHSGTYAIKLTTKSVFGITANGIASTGTLITTPPYGVNGGINYTGRPDSITGWYKYTPAGSDFGFIEFQLLDANNDSIGYVRYNTPAAPVTSYTYFSVPIVYSSAATPTHCIWILSASPGTNPTVNSTITVDDLALVFSGVGVDESQNVLPITLQQNPVNEQLQFNHVKENCMVTMVDVTGKLILQTAVEETNAVVNVSSIPNGIYFYILRGNNQNILTAGKVIINR